MRRNSRTRQLNKCLHKKRYGRLSEAQRWARYRTNSTGVIHTAYECKICFWFHLTTGGFVGQEEGTTPHKHRLLLGGGKDYG